MVGAGLAAFPSSASDRTYVSLLLGLKIKSYHRYTGYLLPLTRDLPRRENITSRIESWNIYGPLLLGEEY